MKKIITIAMTALLIAGCTGKTDGGNNGKSAKDLYTGCSYMRKNEDDHYQIGLELHASRGYHSIESYKTPIDLHWDEFSKYLEPADADTVTGFDDICSKEGFIGPSLWIEETYSVSTENISKVQELFEKYPFNIVIKDKTSGESYQDEPVWPLKIIEE